MIWTTTLVGRSKPGDWWMLSFGEKMLSLRERVTAVPPTRQTRGFRADDRNRRSKNPG
jgi:hypothetical protein